MNVVDHFAVNKLLQSDCEPLSRIGTILYHCTGKLTEVETDEVAKLLAEVADSKFEISENEWQKIYDKGFDDGYTDGLADGEANCDCDD